MNKRFNFITCLFLSLFFYSCQNNNDVILKELKQHNTFLEEQYSFAKNLIKYTKAGNAALVPYYRVFMKQDSTMRKFLNTLSKHSKENINAHYSSFINQSNQYFDKPQKENETKLLYDDFLQTQIKFDSLLLEVTCDSLKNELIKQNILQRYLTIVQIYVVASSSCYMISYNPNCFGFRLTIEKNMHDLLLNLKCFDPKRTPYFEKLEFVSLAQNNKGDYYYSDDLTDIRSKIIEFKYEKDAIILKTKTLKQGFYKIYCNKLSISDNGRIIKEKAEFNFEVTENQ